MKKTRNFTLSLLFGVISIAGLQSCGGSDHKGHQHGKEYTSEYVCPMHCEGSGSEKEGTCPVCGMDYVKNEKK